MTMIKKKLEYHRLVFFLGNMNDIKNEVAIV